MGFLKKLFSKSETVVQRPADVAKVRTRVEVTMTAVVPDLVQLAGTTTTSKESIGALVKRRDPRDTGYLEIGGVLQREPGNKVDPDAVAVLVEGERVGYLPGYVAKSLDLSESGARTVPVQIFTQLLERGLRVEAWAWLGEGSPRWQWSDAKRPPLSQGAKIAARHNQTDSMVKSALAGGGERAEQFQAGMVDGMHYLQAVEPIKQLKREGRLEEALALCYTAIEGAENAARLEKTSPPPFYTEQAAIVHRKLGQRDEEIAVLRRYVKACPPKHRQGPLKERLDKLLG